MLVKTTEDNKIINFYKSYKKVFKKVVNAAKRMSNDRFIKNANCKSKAAWKVVKEGLGVLNKDKNSIESIEYDENTISDPNRISEIFNNYFIDAPLNKQLINHEYNLKHNFNNIPFKFRQVSHNQVEDTIKSLKNKKCSGWDEIPVFLIKLCREFISRPLARIINQSFQTGRFPDKLKYSVIRPIFKKGERSNLSHYRPIALLSAFSKIFERIVNTQLHDFLRKNEILSNSQHGFCNKYSTQSALSKLCNEVYRAVDMRQNPSFDSIDHSLLAEKLGCMV
jgi:hypothetical protein